MIHTAFRPASGPVPADAGLLERWREATGQGNRAYAAGDLDAALPAYRQALVLAARLPSGTEDAVAAFVVSHHNLAQLHEREGRVDEAARHVCAAHEALCVRAADPAGEPAGRDAAWRHSRVTYAELLHFLQRHPSHARARRAARLWPADPGARLPS